MKHALNIWCDSESHVKNTQRIKMHLGKQGHFPLCLFRNEVGLGPTHCDLEEN